MNTNNTCNYSAILCTYNSQDTVRDAVQSIINQSVLPHEIIIIDDCSTDRTCEILDEINYEYPEIVLIKNDLNLGQAECRNIAANFATGSILIMFDDDDISLKVRAEVHLQMHRTGSDISFVSSQKIYENGYSVECSNRDLERIQLKPSAWVAKLSLGLSSKFLDDLWIPACTLAITKVSFESLGGFDRTFRRLEDADFFIRAAKAGLTASWSSTSLVIRKATFSSSKGGAHETAFEKHLILKHQALLSKKDYNRALRLVQVREAYFTSKYFMMFILICKNPLIGVVSFKRVIRFFARLFHDIRKAKSK